MGNYCPNCGASITEDAKFCSNCGKSLEEVYRPVKQAATFNDKAFANQTSLELFKNAYNYEFGIGIEEDICKAAQLYYQAAEAGNSDAMCHFGYLQLYGFGVKRSTQNAMYWMQKGLSLRENTNSQYGKNAERLLKELNAAPHAFIHEDVRYPALLDSIDGYNQYANNHGYMPLSLEDNVLEGVAVDSSSIYFNTELKRHYVNYAKASAIGMAKGGFFSKFKEDFNIGFLGGRFILIVRELIALHLD